MVEFALAFPLQLFILFGLMQTAMLYVSTLVVNYTAYRCARAEIVGEGSTRLEDNGLTGLDTVAQTLLAPLAHSDTFPTDARHVTSFIPGWGVINDSDVAATKVRVEAEEAAGRPDIITVTVEWNQEMIFPLVDRVFSLLMRIGGEDEPEDSAFGTKDERAAQWRTEPMPQPGETRGRVRIFNEKVHITIVRSCSLYRGQAFYGLGTP